MRKLKYYVACTVDRFIARKNGSYDFVLPDGDHYADIFNMFPETIPDHLREVLGVKGESKNFDTVLMGRKTYQVALDLGITNPYSRLEQFVISQSMKVSPDQKVILVSENIVEMVQRLKQGSGRDIWLCGGGQLATGSTSTFSSSSATF